MSEIEKMYRRCKIKKQQTCKSSDTCYNGSLNACEGCNSYQFPPFTAEKQLSLIKWLADSEGISIRYQEGKYIVYDAYSGTIYFDTLDEALAQFVNLLWQDLTESEQEQIRSILE